MDNIRSLIDRARPRTFT